MYLATLFANTDQRDRDFRCNEQRSNIIRILRSFVSRAVPFAFVHSLKSHRSVLRPAEEDRNSESHSSIDPRNWQQAAVRSATLADCEVVQGDSGVASEAYRIIVWQIRNVYRFSIKWIRARLFPLPFTAVATHTRPRTVLPTSLFHPPSLSLSFSLAMSLSHGPYPIARQ